MYRYRLVRSHRLVPLTMGWRLLVIAIGMAMAGCTWGIDAKVSVASQTPFSEPISPSSVVGEPEGQIAFVGDDGNLWLFSLPDGQPRRLTENEQVKSPAWSPDGAQLAYVRKADSLYEIALLNTISQTHHTVSAFRDPMLAKVSWSPDGRYLVGDVGCCATGRELVLLDPGGTQVYRRIPYSFRYAWSPDGKYLALGRDEPLDLPISIEGGDSSSVILLDTVSGAEQMVVQGTSEALYFPVCWLSEKTLIYHQLVWNEARQQGQDKLWQLTINGSLRSSELTTPLPAECTGSVAVTMLPGELREGLRAASWSPDRQWVVVSIIQGEQSEIYLIHSVSHTVRRVATGTEPVWRPIRSW